MNPKHHNVNLVANYTKSTRPFRSALGGTCAWSLVQDIFQETIFLKSEVPYDLVCQQRMQTVIYEKKRNIRQFSALCKPSHCSDYSDPQSSVYWNRPVHHMNENERQMAEAAISKLYVNWVNSAYNSDNNKQTMYKLQ